MADDRDVATAVVETLLHCFINRKRLTTFTFDCNPIHTEDVACTFATAMLHRPIDRASIDSKNSNQLASQFTLTACAFIALHPTHFFPLRFESHLYHCMTNIVLLSQ